MKFLDPKEALRAFGLYGMQHAADFGSGSGHFALAAADRLEGGRLYIIDVDKGMLSRLAAEAKALGHSHVFPIWGDFGKPSGVPLADGVLDRAIVVSTLFAVDDRDALMGELKRLLKPGGKVLIIEWHTDHDIGPSKHHKLSREETLSHFSRHGFTHEKDIDAGDYHYGMIMVRP